MNVSRVSFAAATHNEATQPRSLTAGAGGRECKRRYPPGESYAEMFSDVGSTPTASTRYILDAKSGITGKNRSFCE